MRAQMAAQRLVQQMRGGMVSADRAAPLVIHCHRAADPGLQMPAGNFCIMQENTRHFLGIGDPRGAGFTA